MQRCFLKPLKAKFFYNKFFSKLFFFPFCYFSFGVGKSRVGSRFFRIIYSFELGRVYFPFGKEKEEERFPMVFGWPVSSFDLFFAESRGSNYPFALLVFNPFFLGNFFFVFYAYFSSACSET